MKKTVLTYGLLSGAVVALLVFTIMPNVYRFGFDYGLILGYTTIVLSLLLVPFGIRSYRENAGGGQITFERALAVGLLITLISCVCYVLAWEVVYYTFLPDFCEKYAAYAIAKAEVAGATPQALEETRTQMKDMKVMLDNPLIFAAVGMTEPLPVGLVITLLSAIVLRKKSAAAPARG